MTLNVTELRRDFPILAQTVHGKPLIYLDNAATTQKPQAVIDALVAYYTASNSNVHRGAHQLSDHATRLFEAARDSVQGYLNAAHREEIIWTKGTTDSLNLVAHCFGAQLNADDEIIISALEHHSNIVPWQLLCERTGAKLRVIPVTPAGELDMAAYESLLNERTRLVSVAHVSNALGTINPVERLISLAHAQGAKVCIDGAQGVPHGPVDVQALDCDFYAFSGHKLYGPTGIGILYGKREQLNELPPYQGGGEMIQQVSFAGTTYNELPYKFEAGTPNIAGAIGLGAAIDYLKTVPIAEWAAHEAALMQYAHQCADNVEGLTVVGTAAQKTGAFSFLLDGIHPNDAGTLLDHQGIAVRTGHHCAMPIMEQFGIPGTIRASFAFYNTTAEIDALFAGLAKAQELFA